MSVIDVSNVTKRFGEKIVLDNINFTIEEGEIFGFIGPNGAGKSTMMNILTGVLDSSNGKVSICGNDIFKNPIEAKRCIGYVMQDLALIENLNAYDNLEYFGALYGLSGKVLKERIKEALELAGLTDAKKKKVAKFSGGMKRRLNMAIGVIHHPKIIILDEPTVGVDVQSRNHIFSFIKEVHKKWGSTVIYTSHYMEEVEELCTKLFIIDKGREVAFGSKREIQTEFSKNKQIKLDLDKYMTTDSLNSLENLDGIISVDGFGKAITITANDDIEIIRILECLNKEDYKVLSINYLELKLEDIFIELTGKGLRD